MYQIAIVEDEASIRAQLREYVRRYGPVTLSDLENAECYTWIEGPWPWELRERGDER